MKQMQYLDEVTLPRYNEGQDYQFMDVLENLILIMMVRREIIHFAIKHKLKNVLESHNFNPGFDPFKDLEEE